MNKYLTLIVVLGAFAIIALLVYVAGEMALSNSPLLALVPVAIVISVIVFYIKKSEK